MGYIKCDVLKKMRLQNNLTQKQLAEMLNVSDKAVSKWETGKGEPDISMIEGLSRALGISIGELFSGELCENNNKSANMSKMNFYVCPVCNNIISSVGHGSFSCCGLNLPLLEPNDCDNKHTMNIEIIDDEYFISLNHPMDKGHYISFIAYVTCGNFEFEKLYPQQNAQVRFRRKGHGSIYYYCTQHGLFKKRIGNKE